MLAYILYGLLFFINGPCAVYWFEVGDLICADFFIMELRDENCLSGSGFVLGLYWCLFLVKLCALLLDYLLFVSFAVDIFFDT